MSKPKSILALFTLFLVLVNCKPKPVEVEIPSKDTTSVKKPEVATLSEAPSKIFFKATGTEPFWGIEISDDSIKFTSTEEKDNFSLSYKNPQKAMDANVVLYSAKSENISMEVTIQQGQCSDGMSDSVYNYSVKAIVKRGEKEQILTGCGNYIVDYRLHDIWVLEELEGKKVSKEDFDKELPSMEINAAEAKFTGFAGCNRMGGKLFSEKELLRFTDIFTTEMMCPNYKNEKIFIKALQSTTRFDIKDNRLYLFNPDGTKAVFKKID